MGRGWVRGGGGDGLGTVERELLRWVLGWVRVVVSGWSRHLEFGRHGDGGVRSEDGGEDEVKMSLDKE